MPVPVYVDGVVLILLFVLVVVSVGQSVLLIPNYTGGILILGPIQSRRSSATGGIIDVSLVGSSLVCCWSRWMVVVATRITVAEWNGRKP